MVRFGTLPPAPQVLSATVLVCASAGQRANLPRGLGTFSPPAAERQFGRGRGSPLRRAGSLRRGGMRFPFCAAPPAREAAAYPQGREGRRRPGPARNCWLDLRELSSVRLPLALDTKTQCRYAPLAEHIDIA